MIYIIYYLSNCQTFTHRHRQLQLMCNYSYNRLQWIKFKYININHFLILNDPQTSDHIFPRWKLQILCMSVVVWKVYQLKKDVLCRSFAGLRSEARQSGSQETCPVSEWLACQTVFPSRQGGSASAHHDRGTSSSWIYFLLWLLTCALHPSQPILTMCY